MPDTFSQIYIQIVFAVKNREGLIDLEWEDRLYKYITGIVQNKGQEMLAINGVADHIHIFVRLSPSCCISDLVREVKKSSTEFINGNKLVRGKFSWQEGYGAFSYHKSEANRIINYVMNQKEHHLKQSFKKEYTNFLKEFQIEYKEEHLFDWIGPVST
jgi:putative transposase